MNIKNKAIVNSADRHIKSFIFNKSDKTSVQFFKYSLVGGIAYCVDFGSLFFLTEVVKIHYLISAAIAFILGLLTNYAISILWVFPRRALANKQINEEILFEGVLFGSEKKAILKDGWKLIENTGKKNKGSFHPLGDLTKYRYPEYEKGFELYNINQDFSEKHNLINNYPQIAVILKRHLLAFRMSRLDSKQQRKTKLKEKLDDLKSLGYIK